MSRGWKFPAKLACQNFERKLSGKGLILDRATDTVVEKIIERLEYLRSLDRPEMRNAPSHLKLGGSSMNEKVAPRWPRLLISAFFLCCLLLIAPQLQSLKATQDQVVKQTKEQKRGEKRKRTDLERQRKEDRQKEEWEISTRPPEPTYPDSIRPEFSTAAGQIALLIDNAFNSIPNSRIEFIAANQISIQAASLLFGGAQSEGERQLGQLLYAYAQKVPVCQALAWDSVQSVLALAVYSRSYRQCQMEASRLRGTADRTLARNSQPKESGAAPTQNLESYVVAVERRLRVNWDQSIAPNIRDSGTRCVVTFVVEHDGSVKDVRVAQPSGVAAVDDSAMRAVLSSTPLPALPSERVEPIMLRAEFGPASSSLKITM